MSVAHFSVPSIVMSGEEIGGTVGVSIVMVGPMTVPIDAESDSDPQEKYLLTFRLIDDIDNPMEGIFMIVIDFVLFAS